MNNQGSAKSRQTILQKGQTNNNDFYTRHGVDGRPVAKGYGDTGGASRFFYQAKASKRDRNEGLEELEAVTAGGWWIVSMKGSAGGSPSWCRAYVAKNFHPRSNQHS
jgi:hypothetical protein